MEYNVSIQLGDNGRQIRACAYTAAGNVEVLFIVRTNIYSVKTVIMKGRRCINPLLFLFALSQYQAWIVMTDFVGFQPLGALDGHTCPAEYADTSKNAFNRTKCFLYCATKSSCRGVFFEQETLRCIKCAAQFFQLNDTHSSLSKFYKVKGKNKL